MSNHQSPQQHTDIKSELRNFINLLQTSNPAAYKSIKSSGRLSIILSASQPQSSSMDKQNSSQSANLSIKNSQFQTLENSFISQLLKQLQLTGLSKSQQKILIKLTQSIDQLAKKRQSLENKVVILEEQLSREKKGTDELLEALIKLDEEQKDLWQTYYQLSDKFKQKSTENQALLKQHQQNQLLIQSLKKQLKFVKNLVYVANQNYETLQEKYNNLSKKSHLESRKSHLQSRKSLISVNNTKPILVLREKRSENNLLTERSSKSKHSNNLNQDIYSPYDNTRKKRISPEYDFSSSCSPVRKSSRSIKSRKSISPLQKDKENIECNFKDVYRKMMMKNLKAKKKSIE